MTNDILTGKIVKWIDKKGFGFILPQKGDKQIFVHISSFDRNATRKPRVGDTVYYHLSTDKSGRPCAVVTEIPEVKISKQLKATNMKNNESHSKTINHWFVAVALITIILVCVIIYTKMD